MRATTILLLLVAAVLLTPRGAAAQAICVKTENWEEHRALEERVGARLPPSWLWGAKVCQIQDDGEVICWNLMDAGAPPCVYFPLESDNAPPADPTPK